MAHFGEHITIDGYDGDPVLLNDRDHILHCITGLCATLKMHPLSDVEVISAPDNHIKDPGGWSAFVVIAESHIAIHTFPRRQFLSADVYTCQNGLDADFIGNFFREAFALHDIETNFIKRGTRYPERNTF